MSTTFQCEGSGGSYVLEVTHLYSIKLDFKKAADCCKGLMKSLPEIYMQEKHRAVDVAFNLGIESDIPVGLIPHDVIQNMYEDFKTYLKQEGILS